MKKMTFMLLGLILTASFAIIGCQSDTESKSGTVDTVSGAVTEPGVPQNENETGTTQPAQAVRELKVTAEGAPVEIRFANDGQYHYDYDKDAYAVTTTTNGSAFEITVTDIGSEISNVAQTNVIISIPNQSYTLITGVSTGSSFILPPINGDITLTSKDSSVVVSLPPDYNKTFHYTGNASSCLLSMGELYDFTINAKIATSAVSVPSSWPAYDMLNSNYTYTSGKGTAKIHMDVTSSSLLFE